MQPARSFSRPINTVVDYGSGSILILIVLPLLSQNVESIYTLEVVF